MNEFEKCLKKRDAWSTVFIYDRFAVLILRSLILLKFNKSASSISYVGLICCFMATFSIINEQYILSIILLQLISIIDCVDGKWARYTNTTSNFGEQLDASIDLYAHVVLGLIILSKLYYVDTLLFFTYGINVLLLGNMHIRGFFLNRGLLKPSTSNNPTVKLKSSWDSWTAKKRLIPMPVSEVELAFMVPSLVLIYMSGIDIIWLIMMIYIAFSFSKLFYLIHRFQTK
jgi:phosphatidylglycerophosphate synthase